MSVSNMGFARHAQENAERYTHAENDANALHHVVLSGVSFSIRVLAIAVRLFAIVSADVDRTADDALGGMVWQV